MGWLKNYRLEILLVGLIMANLVVWWSVEQAETRNLTVAFLNVGQGDSIFIEAPNGNQVLIDGGPDQTVLQELAKVMPFYDRSLDLVIATHPDSDHVTGLVQVLRRYQVNGLMTSGQTASSAVAAALIGTAKQKGVPQLTARSGEMIDLGTGVTLQILAPDRLWPGEETNDASVVARLAYGQEAALLTGDLPIAGERALLAASPAALSAELLKVGHHGSQNSTSPEFLKAVKPTLAVISVGKNNRYGHPSERVLSLLRSVPVSWWRTDEQGSLVLKSDGLSWGKR